MIEYRQKKSPKLNEGMDLAIKSICHFYHQLRQKIGYAMGTNDLAAVILAIYAQIKGTCFKQFSDLLGLLELLLQDLGAFVRLNEKLHDDHSELASAYNELADLSVKAVRMIYEDSVLKGENDKWKKKLDEIEVFAKKFREGNM